MTLSMHNIPNILTLSRIALIPVIVVCLMSGGNTALTIAFILFCIAAITDFFDGWVARKYNITSAFGRFLDPIADKLLIACLLPIFCALELLPSLWSLAALIILFREILISGLREFLGPYHVVIHVTTLAKWKTTFQLIACALLIIAPLFGSTALLVAQIAMCFAAIVTAITGWNYVSQGLNHMKDIDQK